MPKKKNPAKKPAGKRDKIKKTLRFEIFKRDGFTCQYCGRTPPEVTLEADHINPASEGGETDINNLITACFDCNRGKRNVPLDKIPNSLKENMEILKEQENQLKEYNKFIANVNKRLYSEALEVDDIYRKYFPGFKLSDHFIKDSIKTFQKSLTKYEIIESMELACTKINDKDKSISYFCGICWNKIKSKADPLYKTISILKSYWNKVRRGYGDFRETLVRTCLEIGMSENDIKLIMDSHRYWERVEDDLNDLINKA